MRVVTILLTIIFFSISFASDYGKHKKVDKFRSFKAHPLKAKVIDYSKEPVSTNTNMMEQGISNKPTSSRPFMNVTATSTNVLVDSSKNGFGWLDPRIRSVDRFKGMTIDMNYNY